MGCETDITVTIGQGEGWGRIVVEKPLSHKRLIAGVHS